MESDHRKWCSIS